MRNPLLKNWGFFIGLGIIGLIPTISYAANRPYAPGEVIIALRGPLQTPSLEAKQSDHTGLVNDPILNKYPIKSIKPLASVEKNSGTATIQSSDAIAYDMYLLTLSPTQDIDTAVQDLSKSEQILFAQPNYIYHVHYIPNDPGFGSQWAVDAVDLKHAWNISTGNTSIKIAVIDTGVATHSDLQNIVIYPRNTFLNNTTVEDDYGHGTHVTGIIAANMNNGIGISGTAPSIKVIPIKANKSDTDEFLSTTICDGIVWAIQNNAHIISMSLGGEGSDTAITNRVTMALTKGIVVVAAAGNEQKNLDTTEYIPSTIPGVWAISAATHNVQNGNIQFDPSYSNYGNRIDFMAPGSKILSTYYDPSNSYAYLTGTSMATPYVSGVVALMKSIEPNATPANLYSALSSTATKPPGVLLRNNQAGYGLINAYKALIAIDTTPPTIVHQPFVITDYTLPFFSITADGVDNSAIVPTISMYYRYVGSIQDVTTPWTVSINIPVKKRFTWILPNTASGYFQYYLKAEDLKPNVTFFASASNPHSVALEDLIPPTITTFHADNEYLSAGSQLFFTLQDNVRINTASIEVRLIPSGGTAPTILTYPHTALSMTKDTLTVFMSRLPSSMPTKNTFSVRVKVKDFKGNETSLSRAFLPASTSTSLSIMGSSSGIEMNSVLTYPNPFDPTKEYTSIGFESNIALDDLVIFIYSLQAKLVAQIRPINLGAGYREESWNGRDNDSDFVPNGVYLGIIKATAQGKTLIKRFKTTVLRR